MLARLIPKLVCLQFHINLKQLVQRAASHPKMAKLLEVVLDHFDGNGAVPSTELSAAAAGTAMPEPAEESHDAAADKPGRVIIFTNRRDSVHTIVDMLRAREPIVTAR